jgi:hypothetical protein
MIWTKSSQVHKVPSESVRLALAHRRVCLPVCVCLSACVYMGIWGRKDEGFNASKRDRSAGGYDRDNGM